MLTDITAVMWKELREIVFPEGRFQGGARTLVIMLGIAGLMFPLEYGLTWFTSWLAVSTSCFPVIVVVNHTADAFAGERERHTLETLLASRLDSRAILVGKLLAIVLYGWGLAVLCQPIATVAINIVYRSRGLMFYRPAILTSIVCMSFLVALLLASIGILVSLTAPTVRVAGQRMLIPFMLIFALPGLLPYLVHRSDWSQQHLAALTPGGTVTILGVLCALVATAAIVAGLRRFRRERLVLA